MLLQVNDLQKRFLSRMALNSLNFTLEAGECVVLAGPNGAGKTTLLRVLAGLLTPNHGTVLFDGKKFLPENLTQKQKIGFAGHQVLLYEDLSAEENLRFFARLYAVENSQSRIDRMLECLNLDANRHERVGGFSRGMLQRLSIGRAWLHQPRLLLLDEPYSGLDTASVTSLDEILYEAISVESAVLMTTHDFEHGLYLADRLDILLGGHIAASLSHEEMQKITPADWYLRKLDESIPQTAGAQTVC